MGAHIQEYRPSDDLRPYVQRFWTGCFDGAHAHGLALRVVPNGFLEFILHLTDHHCDLHGAAGWGQSPDHTLIGVQSETYEVRFTRAVEVFAIRLKPAGFCTLFGVPVSELLNTHEDLVAVLGTRFRAFAVRLRDAPGTPARIRAAEQYLLQAVGQRDLAYVNRAAELIRASGGTLRVADVADRVYISTRQLERAFKKTIGLSPKQYMRIARLNRVQKLLREGQHRGLADVAYQAGYADQSHFTRDFKLLVGKPPVRFLSEQEAYVEVDVNPRADA
jgi:AraC-like DNA-binding protein